MKNKTYWIVGISVVAIVGGVILYMRNKKAQISTTLTWAFALLIIFFILFVYNGIIINFYVFNKPSLSTSII